MESAKGNPPTSPSVREDLVRTAVQFLTNPKVKDSSQEHKEAFLKKKGLNDNEITLAFQRSTLATAVSNQLSVPHPVSLPPQYYGPPQQLVIQQSFWSSWMNVTRAVFVIGGVTCSLYYLFDKYLGPVIFGKKDRLVKVEKTLESLEQKVNEALSTLAQVTLTLEKQQFELARIYGEKQRDSGDSSVSKIETEIASLKGILLGRKQFPIRPSGSVGIPSWQVKPKCKDEDETTSKDPSPVSNGTSSPELMEALDVSDSAGEQIHSD
ncbi:peroxisomal membrane protein PEX14 [Neocloeon triangulifer]|uniref:peroxisomal membrane protein PEX14 n=1 Tax=Neocloeon triangulifer TaxID=2078957 RepID=UPI00286F537C|nr:peroxisomal membrane protein PEX14 [Neocloeon triangulifer]